MSRPLHSHRAQNHFKPGEPLPPGYILTPLQGYGLSRKKRERRGTLMSQSVKCRSV